MTTDTCYHYSVWPQYIISPLGEYRTYGLAAEWTADGQYHRYILWDISPDKSVAQQIANDYNARNLRPDQLLRK